MSDENKKIADFKETARVFAESYLSSIKEAAFLYEAEAEQQKAAKKPSLIKINAAKKAVDEYKEKNADATPEQIERFKKALSHQYGIDMADLERKSSEQPKEPRKLSHEERREEEKKGKASREEREAQQKKDLEARKNKPKGFSREHEKYQRVPPGLSSEKAKELKGSMEKERSEIQDAVRSYKAKHPDASPEDIRAFVDVFRDVRDKQRAKNKERPAPTKHEMAREKVMRGIRPQSMHKRKLGSKITGKVVGEKVLPFAKEIMAKYLNAKKEMERAGTDRPVSTEDEKVIEIVEKMMGMPALDLKNPESQAKFTQARAELFQNPTAFIPAGFLQSSLRSYPEEMSNQLSSELSKKGVENPNFEEFMGKIEDPELKKLASTPVTKDMDDETKRKIHKARAAMMDINRPKQKAMRDLPVKGEHDVRSNRLANYVGDLSMSDVAKMLHFYKNNEREIDASERGYKTPEFIAGKKGFEGVTTGTPEHEENLLGADEDVENEELDKEMAKMGLEPSNFDVGKHEDTFGVGEELGRGKDVTNPEETKQLHSDVFDFAKKKNALSNYFDDFNHLVNFGSGEHVGQPEKLAMASKFLQKTLSDPGMKRIIVQGLSRQYALNVMKKKIEEEFTARSYDKQTPEKKKEMLKRALEQYTPQRVAEFAKHKESDVKSALGKMLYTNKEGRMTLKSPDSVTWPDENLKSIATTVYSKLLPGHLSKMGESGSVKPFDEFMVSKAAQVHKAILDTIRTLGSRHLATQQKAELEKGMKEPTSEEARAELVKKKLEDRERRGAREQAKMKHPDYPAKKQFPGGSLSGKEPEAIGVNPQHIAPKALREPASGRTAPDIGAQARAYVAQWRKAHPEASPEAIEQIAKAAQSMIANQKKLKAESLMTKIEATLVWEGKEMNIGNIKEYLVKSVKHGRITKENLEEVLRSVNGHVTEAPKDLPWETIQKKEKRKKGEGPKESPWELVVVDHDHYEK